MKPFSRNQEGILVALAVFGLIVPNGIFIHSLMTAPETLQAALGNRTASLFISEAFALMFFFAWLIHTLRLTSPGWVAFLVMSIVGSMLFSIPAFLYLSSRKARRNLSV